MGIFLIYILKSAVCLSLFYLFYRLLLSKETFHRFNRIALLGILFLSLLIPFIEVTTAHQTELSQTVLTVEQLLMVAEAMDPAEDFKIFFPFALSMGFPFSSRTGLESHFLLRLTCVIVSFTVPRRASSLHRFDQRICFSTTGI